MSRSCSTPPAPAWSGPRPTGWVPPEGLGWDGARFLPTGQLVVREWRPATPTEDAPYGDVSVGLVRVAPRTGVRLGPLTGLPVEANSTDVDRTGRHVLVAAGSLERRHGDDVVVIGREILQAAWVG